MHSNNKILFVSHEASFTGAPIILLHFLNWLKQRDLFIFHILLTEGGALKDDFSVVGDTTLPEPLKKNYITRAYNKFIKAADPVHPSIRQLATASYDLIYINTVRPLYLAPIFKKANPGCKVICHVHENEYTTLNFFPDAVIHENTENVDHFIAVSGSTKDNLVKNLKIDPNRITLVNECIALDSIKKPQRTAGEVKAELDINNQFVVGGSGVASWRKGTDLFLHLALRLKNKGYEGKIKLVWVGTVMQDFQGQFKYEAERLGIKQMVVFTGPKKNPQDYFQIFDVFTLTSREDPFPLVALEAAALQKPIICFNASGGIPELILKHGQEGGTVVAYGDVEAMANAVITFYEDRQLLIRKGKAIAATVDEFDVNEIAPKLLAVINKVLAGNQYNLV